jgi:hypothetical protein
MPEPQLTLFGLKRPTKRTKPMRKTTMAQVRRAEKMAKRAALQEKINVLRGKEIAAGSRASEMRFRAQRIKLQAEHDRLRVRRSRRP